MHVNLIFGHYFLFCLGSSNKKIIYLSLGTESLLLRFNPHTPVAQKTADEVVFRRFQGEGVEFFFKSPDI